MAPLLPSSPRSASSQRGVNRASNDEVPPRHLQGASQPETAQDTDEHLLSGPQPRRPPQHQQRPEQQQEQPGSNRSAHLRSNGTGAALSRASSSDDISTRDGRRSPASSLHRSNTANSGTGSDTPDTLLNGPHPNPSTAPSHRSSHPTNGTGNGSHRPPRPNHGSQRRPPSTTAPAPPSTATSSKRSQPPASPTPSYTSPLGLFNSLSSLSSLGSGLSLRRQTSLLSILRPAASSPSAASPAASLSTLSLPPHPPTHHSRGVTTTRRTLSGSSPLSLSASPSAPPTVPAHRTLSATAPPPPSASGASSASRTPSPGALIRYVLTPL
ncbi:hypothetical protein Agub_g11507, partial [Astrephomene gubernaculifera]